MDYMRNPKIVGSFLVGFALVAGAYVTANFGKPRHAAPAAVGVATEAPVRAFIPVSDQDEDGVEDWRDQFIEAPAVTLTDETVTDYVPPSTLTGQLGVSLIEDVLRIKAGGPVSKTKEQVVVESVTEITEVSTRDKIYDTRDIIVNDDPSSEAVRAYGNNLASIIMDFNIPGIEGELEQLMTYVNAPEQFDNTNLLALANMYKNYRDYTRAIPVPRQFIKPHLDLINVYHALHIDINAMAEATTDPMVTLVRLKRYEDDAAGLYFAFSNMHDSLLPYAAVFGANDPALVLASFYQESP